MRDFELPEFLSAACDDVRSELSARELCDALPQLLAPNAALGRERLVRAVTALPLRYAPFFQRIGVLWDLPERDVEALLTKASDPLGWRKPKLPGLRVFDVQGGPWVHGASVTLVRFSPGMRFPAHHHPGPEALLVLEGSYHDQSGRVVGPGDLHQMAPGSEHWFEVGREEPCVAASVQFGLEFTGPVMKVLVRLFG